MRTPQIITPFYRKRRGVPVMVVEQSILCDERPSFRSTCFAVTQRAKGDTIAPQLFGSVLHRVGKGGVIEPDDFAFSLGDDLACVDINDLRKDVKSVRVLDLMDFEVQQSARWIKLALFRPANLAKASGGPGGGQDRIATAQQKPEVQSAAFSRFRHHIMLDVSSAKIITQIKVR